MFSGLLLRLFAALCVLTYAVGATAAAEACVQQEMHSSSAMEMPGCPDMPVKHDCVAACGDLCAALVPSFPDVPRLTPPRATEAVVRDSILVDWPSSPDPPPPRTA